MRYENLSKVREITNEITKLLNQLDSLEYNPSVIIKDAALSVITTIGINSEHSFTQMAKEFIEAITDSIKTRVEDLKEQLKEL
jgi:hypothetical protein